MVQRNLTGKVDKEVQRTIEELDQRLRRMEILLQAKSSGGNGDGEGFTARQKRDIAGLIGALSQGVIGQETPDPVLPGQVGSGNVSTVSASTSVPGLTISVTNPSTAPDISLTGTPNIGAGNVTSGVLAVARGGTGTGAPSGTYTPTLTNVANLDASTAYQCQFIQVGNTVVVSGKVDIDPTAAVSTQLGISLPVASNFGAVEDCGGAAFAQGIAGQGAAILADAANNRAQLEFIAADLTNQAMYFVFAYQVI